MIALTSLLAVAVPLALSLATAVLLHKRKWSKVQADICAWCPDHEEQTKLYDDLGIRVSHGICESCYEQQINNLNEER